MLLNALVLGYAIPTWPFKGQVHSIFRHAVNIRLEDGTLLTLVTPDEDDLPQGVRLSGPQNLNFLQTGIAPGQYITCTSGLLRWEAIPFQIDLSHAKRWRCDFNTFPQTQQVSCLQKTLGVILDLLEEHSLVEPAGLHPGVITGIYPNSESSLNLRAGEVICKLIEAARHCHILSNSTVQPLIGLGPGLTPSGDDFLVGFLAGLWSGSVHHPLRRNFTHHLGRVICSSARGHTGEVSFSYLFHATQGQFSRRLFNLVYLLFTGASTGKVLRAALDVLSVGHTSGSDILIGLLAGLMPWSQVTFSSTHELLTTTLTGGAIP